MCYVRKSGVLCRQVAVCTAKEHVHLQLWCPRLNVCVDLGIKHCMALGNSRNADAGKGSGCTMKIMTK